MRSPGSRWKTTLASSLSRGPEAYRKILILSFDLKRSIRRLKPEQRKGLSRRPDDALPFVPDRVRSGSELLLDTCVYVDLLKDSAPNAVKELLSVRLSNHSGVAIAELTHLFGRLDPQDRRTNKVLSEIAAVISEIP